MRKLVTLLYSTLLGVLAATTPLPAMELQYSLQAGAGYSDNVNESALDPTGSGMLIPQLDFRLKELGSTVQANAVGDIRFIDYLGGGFSNQLLGQLSGIFDWAVVPQRLHFIVEDDASVQPVNILQPNSPANVQQVNVLSLGPTLQFRLGPALRGEADFRVLNSVASKTDEFNSLREIGTLRAIRDLAPTRQISFNVEGQHVHFTNQPVDGMDYDRYSAFGRYQSKLAHLDLDLSLGYSHLDGAASAHRSSPLIRGTVNWRATPRSTFAVSVARSYSDAAEDLGDIDFNNLASLDSGILVGTATINSEIYLQRRVDAAYGFEDERIGFHVSPYWRKLSYLLDANLNQTNHGASVDVRYRFQRLWTLGLLANEETRNYNALARRDEDIRLGLYLLQQFNSHWSWRFDLVRGERNSTALDQGYLENIGLLTVIFTR